ncbi:hypothetical protein JHW43_009126 [Diplocarpon mali]|nr:hypothetical protein JHW43_009126 [Diplocarpon mali]
MLRPQRQLEATIPLRDVQPLPFPHPWPPTWTLHAQFSSLDTDMDFANAILILGHRHGLCMRHASNHEDVGPGTKSRAEQNTPRSSLGSVTHQRHRSPPGGSKPTGTRATEPGREKASYAMVLEDREYMDICKAPSEAGGSSGDIAKLSPKETF